MEKWQAQLTALNDKVDALHQLVEQMSHQLTDLIAQQNNPTVDRSEGQAFSQNTPSPAIASNKASSGHKDVLEDGHNLERLLDYNTNERSLSPDLQIRRLTAQVTAAYNRIAALEEQLLAQRSDREEKKLIRTLPENS